MSACFNAGASFTPSPVIAQTFPFLCHALTILILFSGETLAKTLQNLTFSCNSLDIASILTNLFKDISEQIFSFVKGTGLIAILVFAVSAICFGVSGLKAAIFFALWNAITNIIPYVGPYIGGIPIIAVAFATDFRLGIIITIVVVAIQILESYILHPIVMSKTMKLHPVTIIIGLLVFGHFFGIVGMLIATPATAILKTIWLFVDDKYKITIRLEKRNSFGDE
mgnify:CR=1 FL=1